MSTSGTGAVSSAVVMVGSAVRTRRTFTPAAAVQEVEVTHADDDADPHVTQSDVTDRNDVPPKPRRPIGIDDRACGDALPGVAVPAPRRRATAEPARADAPGSAADPDLRFPIASLSKQMTAVCALSLVTEGLLDLHAPLRHWLPEAAPQWHAITVHQLLTHTAGFGHWDDRPGYEIHAPRTVDERIVLFLRSDPLSPPGQRWHYSSPGYIVLGHVLERITGRAYAAYLSDRILRPLGLARTTAGSPPVAPLAVGHAGGRRVARWEPGVLAGTTDVWSTAEDVARFTTALHGGALLDAERLARMVTAHASATLHARHDDSWLDLPGYGYGLYCGTLGGQPVLLHTGELPGFRAIGVWLPRQAAAVAVLANDEEADLPGELKDLLPELAPARERAQADSP